MGQKISVELFRAKQKMANTTNKNASIVSTPKSMWFASGKTYGKVLLQDYKLREFLDKRLFGLGVAKVEIRRFFRKLEIIIYSTKPGLIIGRGGELINGLKQDLIKNFKLSEDLKLSIQEFRDPNRSAKVIAEDIASALKKRVPFRKVAKNYIDRIRYAGVLGAKIVIKGRLNGADIARKEEFTFGSIPRHTIDSQIDVAHVDCHTFAGVIGVRVYLYLGDKLTNYSF
jgi:small subunit ribosomal protein S3